jgi:hypothetical protein
LRLDEEARGGRCSAGRRIAEGGAGATVSNVPVGEQSYQGGVLLSSLEEAVVVYRELVDSDTGWPEGCLPMWADGGGWYHVVDLSLPAGPVRDFWTMEARCEVEFGSVGAMLATLAEAFRRGMVSVRLRGGRGSLEVDGLAFAELAAELNPGVPYWPARIAESGSGGRGV